MDSKDRPYSWHMREWEKAGARYDAASIALCDAAIAAGHGHVMPAVLRRMPEYFALYAARDAALAAQEAVEAGAVAAKCAWCENGRFNWYSPRDAARWRRKAA